MRRVIIVGANGQDGRILYDRLRDDGCAVLGIARDAVRSTEPGAPVHVDITDRRQVLALVTGWRPDQVYYLAACHHSSEEQADKDTVSLFEQSHAVHVRGLLHFLEAMREVGRATRLFFAASSLVFGNAVTEMQDERTPMNPRCIYGITKAVGVRCCRYYRETHGVFAAAGILYNHESAYRQKKFVSQKIIRAAIGIANGRREKLILGDLSAKIDWGYAPDFADAMVRILALPEPDDFIVATGEAHTVREFAEIVFASLGLDWKAHVEEDASVLHRRRRTLMGNASKLRAATGWQPSVTFAEMVERLATAYPSRES
jgi:GDPmannose 4,6-dehydratase